MTRFGLAEVREDGFLVRGEVTFTDLEEAVAVAAAWQLRKGLTLVGVADLGALELVWRSDGGSISLPYRGQRESTAPPKLR